MDTFLDLSARVAIRNRVVGAWALANQCDSPITYVDVGACWGVDNLAIATLRELGLVKVVGFEPDASEFQKLSTNEGFQYLPYALSDTDGYEDFYVTSHGAQSSLYEPDLDALPEGERRESARVVKKIRVETRCYDTLCRENQVPTPEFLKIDAQGGELKVLRGFKTHLADVIGIRLEAHLRPLYKGQPLLPDVYAFLREHGFILREIRPMSPEVFEVVEVEAYFSKDPQKHSSAKLQLWGLAHDISPPRVLRQNDWRMFMY